MVHSLVGPQTGGDSGPKIPTDEEIRRFQQKGQFHVCCMGCDALNRWWARGRCQTLQSLPQHPSHILPRHVGVGRWAWAATASAWAMASWAAAAAAAGGTGGGGGGGGSSDGLSTNRMALITSRLWQMQAADLCAWVDSLHLQVELALSAIVVFHAGGGVVRWAEPVRARRGGISQAHREANSLFRLQSWQARSVLSEMQRGGGGRGGRGGNGDGGGRAEEASAAAAAGHGLSNSTPLLNRGGGNEG